MIKKENIRVTVRLERGSSRIVSVLLPEIGETIYVEQMGHAVVEEIFHGAVKMDNYIKLQFLDTLVGEFRQEFSFTKTE